ncbi:major capsid protein [robinz microvirus RP_153]|nr:major capsid protein [robinz microvirus RP_153]
MRRAKHSLSHYKLLTCDMGKLIPVGVYEVLPGDSIQQSTSSLIRVSPLVAPVMHPISVRIHHWYVPHRIVWPGWEDFITGGPDGLGGSAGAYPAANITPVKGDLADYFGLPVGVASDASLLPFRAYAKIFNEFYRDQDLVAEILEDQTAVQNIAWEKDQYTSARPWPQKGPDVSMPLGVDAPVVPLPATSGQPLFTNIGGTFQSPPVASVGLNQMQWTGNAPATEPMYWASSGLKADLSNASAVNVNDVRRAFALQRYQEARAMYGSRYTEYLRYLGVRSSDARLQRPEYLGGGKQVISFSEVLQTGPDTEDLGVADLKGHGIAAMRSRRWRHFFEEHGHVMTLLSVRPRTMYTEGLHRSWSRRTKEDYWQRELELIGQQEIFTKEIYGAAPADQVFGFNDRYNEYRHLPSSVAGDFRDTLNYWHLARSFGAAPVLNQSFVECDSSKRIHAVQTEHVLWIMANNNIQARRMVGRPTIPRIF